MGRERPSLGRSESVSESETGWRVDGGGGSGGWRRGRRGGDGAKRSGGGDELDEVDDEGGRERGTV
jgi:hypothetical protein